MKAITTIRLINRIDPEDEDTAKDIHADGEIRDAAIRLLKIAAEETFTDSEEIEVTLTIEEDSQ